MARWNLGRYALSLSIGAAALFAGCGGSQSATGAVRVNAVAPEARAVRTRGGAFTGAYSGGFDVSSVICGSEQYALTGAGKGSFLRQSTEFTILLGACLKSGWSGSSILTSSKDPANAIYVNFPLQVQGMCLNYPFSYTVIGGTGKFARATGSGTVTFKFKCHHFFRRRNGLYSDHWSGTLYY